MESRTPLQNAQVAKLLLLPTGYHTVFDTSCVPIRSKHLLRMLQQQGSTDTHSLPCLHSTVTQCQQQWSARFLADRASLLVHHVVCVDFVSHCLQLSGVLFRIVTSLCVRPTAQRLNKHAVRQQALLPCHSAVIPSLSTCPGTNSQQ